MARSKPITLAIGQRFGRLAVIGEPAKGTGGRTVVLCRCDCGTERAFRRTHLVSGATLSCGCYARDRTSEVRRVHGMVGSPTYAVWQAMKARCLNPRNPAYAHYGGRGIGIDRRWKESFDAFLSDMGLRPSGMSIERIDNNRGYEPGNCKWATDTEQANNRRSSAFLTVDGETMTIAQWSKKTGLPAEALRRRVLRGWSPRDAIQMPLYRPGVRYSGPLDPRQV